MRLALLLLLTACAHRGYVAPPARAGDAGAKMVYFQWQPDPDAWRHSPWYRMEQDTGTPMRVVISKDAYACILGFTADEPLPDSFYVCASGWRYPRVR